MSGLELVGAVTGGYAALYAVLYLVAIVGNARYLRRAVPLYQEIDPYHALAVRSGGPAGMDQAALAALLIDGLITVDANSVMAVAAPAGGGPAREPVHPVPAAWLECLHRAERPAVMAELRDDPELRQRHADFLRQEKTRVIDAEWPDFHDAGCVLLLAAVVVGLFDAVALTYALPRWFLGTSTVERIIGGVIVAGVLAFLIVVLLSAPVTTGFPKRLSRLAAQCARMPPHPAVAALTAEQHQRLLAGDRRTTRH